MLGYTKGQEVRVPLEVADGVEEALQSLLGSPCEEDEFGEEGDNDSIESIDRDEVDKTATGLNQFGHLMDRPSTRLSQHPSFVSAIPSFVTDDSRYIILLE